VTLQLTAMIFNWNLWTGFKRGMNVKEIEKFVHFLKVLCYAWLFELWIQGSTLYTLRSCVLEWTNQEPCSKSAQKCA